MAIAVHAPILGPQTRVSRGFIKKAQTWVQGMNPTKGACMLGYVAVFAVGVYYAPAVKREVKKQLKKARKNIRQNYGV